MAVEGHAGLRSLVVKVHTPTVDSDEDNSDDEDSDVDDFERIPFDYLWLERLLSRNRNITVLDASHTRISNGSSIEQLYALNHFYHGSATLVKEQSASLRPLLATTTLVESAAGNLQHTALLLTDHTDTLGELIHDLPEDAEMPVSQTTGSDQTEKLKRKARIQPSRAAKKGARHET